MKLIIRFEPLDFMLNLAQRLAYVVVGMSVANLLKLVREL